jgi:hypothetical protein
MVLFNFKCNSEILQNEGGKRKRERERKERVQEYPSSCPSPPPSPSPPLLSPLNPSFFQDRGTAELIATISLQGSLLQLKEEKNLTFTITYVTGSPVK